MMDQLINDALNCKICEAHLPYAPRPVFSVHPIAKILIVGQAPGRKVNESGIPWADASGQRLRNWLGVEAITFYDPTIFSLLPMGFCFPGTGKSGDLPPRPECALKWHDLFIRMMSEIKLTLLFGQYAQERYLGKSKKDFDGNRPALERIRSTILATTTPFPKESVVGAGKIFGLGGGVAFFEGGS
ncbi:MAG: uracil-DNA glycosylase family protein [Saprospiraceae bacterium]